MSFIPDILEQFIQGMDYEMIIRSVSYSAPNSTVSVGDIKHLRAGLIVEIDSTPTPVLDVNYTNNTFDVLGDVTGASIAKLPTPWFFHGTPRAINAELSRLQPEAKFPFVALIEPYEEDLGGQLSRQVVSNLTLLFLDQANYADWDTDAYYSERILPMRRFADYFLWDIKQNKGKARHGDSSRIINWAKFGKEGQGGAVSSIFNERLSGCELNVELRFIDCQDYKGLNPEPTPAYVPPPEQPQGLESPLEFELTG